VIPAIYTEADLLRAPWRVGRHLGRTLYAVVGDEPSRADIVLGMVDTEAIAAAIVHEHNERL
jgi:hypothetical protein